MTMYDRVELHDGAYLPSYPGVVPRPERVTWRTYSTDDPVMGLYRLTAAGRLLEREWEYRFEDDRVREESRAVGDWMTGAGERVGVGWTARTDYDGVFRFERTFDRIETTVAYAVTVHDGRLAAIERAE